MRPAEEGFAALDQQTAVAGSPARLTKALALAAILSALLLRLTALAAPLGIDQGIYATAAWRLRQGAAFYRDVWDQKPPGIHLTYLAGFELLGRHPETVLWLDLIAAAITIWLLVVLGGRIAGARFGWIVAAIYAVATIPAMRYGLGGFLERAVPESFICLLALSSGCCAASWACRPRASTALAFGVAVGAAIVYKPTAAVYWPAFAFWAGVEARHAHRSWRDIRVFLGASLAGMALIPGLIALWIASQGGAADAIVALSDYNRAYLTTGPGWTAFTDLLAHDLWRRVKNDPLWLIGAAAVPFALRAWTLGGRSGSAAGLGVCWLAAATIAAAANGFRLYTTYFMPTLPPLAWLAAWLFSATAAGPRERLVKALEICVLVLALVAAHRGGYFVRGWQATAADVAGLMAWTDRSTYLERFGGYANGRGYSARANAELTEYLRRETTSADAIFIFGMQPGVYFTSARRPASRYLWAGPVIFRLLPRPEFGMAALTRALDAAPARLIILERHYRDSQLGMTVEPAFAEPEIVGLLQRYDRLDEVEDFVVFRRRD